MNRDRTREHVAKLSHLKAMVTEEYALAINEAITALQQPVLPDKDVLLHVGYTNPCQIEYAGTEEGAFYPDTDNECYIPLYMLKIHFHRLGHDYDGRMIEIKNKAAQQGEG